MSSKAKRPNALDRLVTRRDLFAVIAAMNKATRALEERIEALERPVAGCVFCPEDYGVIPDGATNEAPA